MCCVPLLDSCLYSAEVGELQVGFQDVASCPSELVFTPHFIVIGAEFKASDLFSLRPPICSV